MHDAPSMPQRPARVEEQPVSPLPDIDARSLEQPSVLLSAHRTRLSTHRTGLSEHRTALSEHRTDLSTYRTELSVRRTEMSARRTGMSFQRTRLSAERTLMSVIRTSLSLISFGFTIFQIFRKASESALIAGGSGPARDFGVALVLLGIGVLTIGIVYHVTFMAGLRSERRSMADQGLIHAETRFPPSPTLIAAVLLLALGLAAVLGMVFGFPPFA